MLNKTQLIPKICFAAHVAHEIVALNFLFSAAMKTKTTAKATRTTTTIASTASNLRVAGRESIYVCMTEDYGYVSEQYLTNCNESENPIGKNRNDAEFSYPLPEMIVSPMCCM